MPVLRRVLLRVAAALVAAVSVAAVVGHGHDLSPAHKASGHASHSSLVPSPEPAPAPSATPAPQSSSPAPPSPSSRPPDDTTDKDDVLKAKDCDPLEFDCKIRETINGWFASLAKAAIKAVFGGMGGRLTQTPQVDRLPRVEAVWQQTLWIANATFVLLVMAGGVLLMGHETVQTSYSAKQVAPRLVLAFTTANFSRQIVGQALEFTNSLAAALVGPDIDAGQAVKLLGDRLDGHMSSGSIFLVLLVLVAAFLGCALAVTYLVRIMITIVLLVGGPLALACHALPQTEPVARLWWRLLGAVLAVQVVQTLVFVIALKVMFTRDGARELTGDNQLWDMILVLCLLYVLIRVPTWVTHLVVQGSAPRSPLGRAGTYFYLRYELRRVNRGFRAPRRQRQGNQPAAPQNPPPQQGGGGVP